MTSRPDRHNAANQQKAPPQVGQDGLTTTPLLYTHQTDTHIHPRTTTTSHALYITVKLMSMLVHYVERSATTSTSTTMTSSAVISVAWWSSDETVGVESERWRGGGDISISTLGDANSSDTARTCERREREVDDAEEGEAEGLEY